jgi:hypothetical protein
MTTPVLSDQVVSLPAPAGEVLEFSGSPSSPRKGKLELTSIMFVSTLCFAVGSATISTVVAGVVVEFEPIGTEKTYGLEENERTE